MQSPSPRSRSQQFLLKQDMGRNVLLKFIEIIGVAVLEPIIWEHGGRKPTETSVSEFCNERVNLSLEELKNIKVIPFLVHK